MGTTEIHQVPTLQKSLDIIRSVSALVAPKPNTALQMLQMNNKRSPRERSAVSRWHLQTGVDELDRALGGGLPSKLISEITGPPGVGKTQFCLTCLLSALSAAEVQFQKEGASVIYIDTVGILRFVFRFFGSFLTVYLGAETGCGATSSDRCQSSSLGQRR